jgi:tripartite-type tricarboxylate transporter receptor subunit TctC
MGRQQAVDALRVCAGYPNTQDRNLKLYRREFLCLAAGIAASPAMPPVALAETYPTRPVRIVVGFPASNASDIVGRLGAQALSERLGQQFIVDNRPGAGGNIGTEFVVRAAADGYTLLLASPSTTTNATLYGNLTFNFLHDIAPAAGIARAPYLMVLNPALPAKTVPEFIAYAKANPGKINMASSGNGSLSHMCGALFMSMAGVNMVHVPYRTSFLPDLLAGQVQVVFAPVSQVISYIGDGKLRALAVTTESRQETLPDIPAVGEFVPGYEASGWYGLGAPRATAAEIIDTLHREISAALIDPAMKTQLANVGAVPMPMTPADFGKFLTAETEKWGKLIRADNIKVD